MQLIKEFKNLKGKRVLVRVDYNVPMKNGKVLDSFRILKSFKTISFLQNKGAKIILISHLGKGEESMKNISLFLNKFFKNNFISEFNFIELEEKTKKMKNGEIIFLENLRFNKGEKDGDKVFAKSLALLGDVYVNESFSVSHRKDASVFLLPKLLPSYAGFQLFEEIKNLSLFSGKVSKPFLFILGGAKFSTKIPLINKFLNKADFVFVGGALVNNLLKAKGLNVGKSLIDEKVLNLNKILKNKKLILPIDLLVENSGFLKIKKIEEVSNEDSVIDIGSETTKILSSYIKKSKVVLWNGPLGKYEVGGERATQILLKEIAKNKTKSILGGGDTVALISKLRLEDKFNFVSTGGGAMLAFLEKGTLPGIKVLK